MKPLNRSLIGHRTPRGETRAILAPPGGYFYRFELAEHVVIVPTIFVRSRRAWARTDRPLPMWDSARGALHDEIRVSFPYGLTNPYPYKDFFSYETF